MKTDLKLSATSSGKSITTTLAYIKNDATRAEMLGLSEAMNGLTENTYVSTDRVQTENVDTLPVKQTPSLTLGSEVDPLTRTRCLAGTSPLVEYTGDGELSIVNNDNTTWCTTFRQSADSDTLRLYIGIVNQATADNATAPHDIVIRSAETDNYYAGEFTITIIADE